MTRAQIALVETIVGHLHAAHTQRSPKDDQIISEHIDTALEAGRDLLHAARVTDPTAEPLDPMRGVEFPFARNH